MSINLYRINSIILLTFFRRDRVYLLHRDALSSPTVIARVRKFLGTDARNASVPVSNRSPPRLECWCALDPAQRAQYLRLLAPEPARLRRLLRQNGEDGPPELTTACT